MLDSNQDFKLPIIKRTEVSNKFVLRWLSVNETLILDFNPLINSFGLTENNDYCLVHYQAKPKILRTWGCMYKNSNGESNYYAITTLSVKTKDCITLKLDETALILPPHAVLYYPNSSLTISNTIGVIEET